MRVELLARRSLSDSGNCERVKPREGRRRIPSVSISGTHILCAEPRRATRGCGNQARQTQSMDCFNTFDVRTVAECSNLIRAVRNPFACQTIGALSASISRVVSADLEFGSGISGKESLSVPQRQLAGRFTFVSPQHEDVDESQQISSTLRQAGFAGARQHEASDSDEQQSEH